MRLALAAVLVMAFAGCFGFGPCGMHQSATWNDPDAFNVLDPRNRTGFSETTLPPGLATNQSGPFAFATVTGIWLTTDYGTMILDKHALEAGQMTLQMEADREVPVGEARSMAARFVAHLLPPEQALLLAENFARSGWGRPTPEGVSPRWTYFAYVDAANVTSLLSNVTTDAVRIGLGGGLAQVRDGDWVFHLQGLVRQWSSGLVGVGADRDGFVGASGSFGTAMNETAYRQRLSQEIAPSGLAVPANAVLSGLQC